MYIIEVKVLKTDPLSAVTGTGGSWETKAMRVGDKSHGVEIAITGREQG